VVIQCVPDLRERMLAAVHVEGCRLDMGDWFGEPDDEPPCGTVACLAGWAIKCHPQGWQVVEHVRSHPSSAGTYSGSASLILEACGITPPDFFDCGDEDLEKGLDWKRPAPRPTPAP
jgi:hypothetical protein